MQLCTPAYHLGGVVSSKYCLYPFLVQLPWETVQHHLFAGLALFNTAIVYLESQIEN